MTSHNVVAQVYLNGAWTTVNSEVHEGTIRTQRGFTQYGDLRPAKLEWQFEDPASKWNPGNPASTVYGAAGRAMPARVRIGVFDRCCGEVTELAPDRTLGFAAGPPQRGRQWVDMTAEGVLSRISGWDTPLRSPMYFNITSLANLIGHWPLEDGRDATQLTNTVPGGTPGTTIGMSFGEDGPDGAESVAKFLNADSTSKISGKFVRASTTAGWQIAWSIKLTAIPAAGPYQLISWRTTNGYRYAINLNTNSFNIKIDDGDGVNLVDTSVGFIGFASPDNWDTMRFKVTASGGTVSWALGWYQQGAPSMWGTSGTFAGTVGALDRWSANGNPSMQNGLIGHVYGVTTGTDDLLSYASIHSFDGYVGETAGDRFLRLMDQLGVLTIMLGDPDDTAPMGKQTASTTLALLQEIGRTDQALIYDTAGEISVTMRSRAHMYDTTPKAFTYPDDFGGTFRERYDFVGVQNLVTAKQLDGGEATAALTTGPLSTQPFPAGVGEKKGSVDVNVATDDQLGSIANWVMRNGTVPGARYPQVTIDLDRRPDLISLVNSVELGDTITITGRAPDVIILLVIGIDEQIDQYRRLVTFTCVPGDVFAQVGRYDDAALRYDVSSSTVKSAVASGATSAVFRTTNLIESWSTSAVPYAVMIAGQRNTVTAITAPTLVSGAWEQTATLTRAVNGVVKALAAGDEVHIANPGRYGI